MNFAKQLSQGLSHQVDMLSLENTMGVDGLNEIDAEAIENETVESPEDVSENNQDIEETADIAESIDDAAVQLEVAGDAEVTLESISASLEKAMKQGGLSVVGASFAQSTLASVSTRMGLDAKAGRSLVPDLQSFTSPSDALAKTEVTMLGVMDAISGITDFIFTVTTSITNAIHNWTMKCSKAIEGLAKRSAKLRSKSREYITLEGGAGREFKATRQQGKNLSATAANIVLAQRLYLGPHDDKVQGITQRMELLNKIMHDYLGTGVNSIESIADGIARTAASLNGEVIDGALFNSLHTIASKIAHTQHMDEDAGLVHVSQELFGGMAFSIAAEKPATTMTLHELKEYAGKFAVGIGMVPVRATQKATKQTWHNYVLKGLTSDESMKLLDLVDEVVSTMRTYSNSAQHQVAMGKRLAAEGKAAIKTAVNKRAARAALRCAIIIWRASCTGAHDLVQHGLHVCSNVLEYVGKSISSLKYWLSGYLGAGLRGGGTYAGGIWGGVKGGATVGAGVGALVGLKPGNGGILGNALNGGLIGAGVGAYPGAAIGAYRAVRNEGRRFSWDRAAKKHQSENNHSSTH